MEQEEKICSKDNPMPIGENKRYYKHIDEVYKEDDYGKGGGVADGDFEVYYCPNCKNYLYYELPN